jgi:indolepyruvate ferredoxin oxidoreductase alpha subunit
MAERSFAREARQLRLGAGEEFRGEGILAVAKALLQSGVSYVGGYQGAPISHLMDVFNDARDVLADYGVHFERNASEAGAAAMLAASINYPLRGAVTWKSTVGTNVASDALSNLASAGVTGGAMIVLGEDYGEGASIMQERTHPFATKSQIWLLDPRPSLPKIVDTVERGFLLSEATNTPVMTTLRIRACHVYGRFIARDNVRGRYNALNPLPAPAFDYGRIVLPPSTYAQEKHKIEVRFPAALDWLRRNPLNEVFDGEHSEIGIIVQGGHFNSAVSVLEEFGLADVFGRVKAPVFCLNVGYPLVPEEIVGFCAGKSSVLVIEEGQPAYLEMAVSDLLRRHGVATRLHGKDVLPLAGEYTLATLMKGMGAFLTEAKIPAGVRTAVRERLAALESVERAVLEDLRLAPPPRPPGFCTGCPERPVFTAMKLVEREVGPFHVASDIGCHTFSTLPPFNIGNTVLGYGLGLASASALPSQFGGRPVVTVMGDGGFWHNGLSSGVSSAVFNRHNDVMLIMDNGYTAATGGQDIPSSRGAPPHTGGRLDIAATLAGMGVTWVKTLNSYRVTKVRAALKEAMTSREPGLKVIIAEGECQLNKERRLRAFVADLLKRGKRLSRDRYGVDESVCTGDHACVRLSGCPSLTIKPSSDPLKTDPVAHVVESCVGCGLCGEVAHAARLCPSFYRARTVRNAHPVERLSARLKGRLFPALKPLSS